MMGDKLLKEIQKSFPLLKKLFNEETLLEFCCCEYRELYIYHIGFGTWINKNLLNDDGRLFHLFTLAGIFNRDDMSEFIIRLFYIEQRMVQSDNTETQ